MSTRPTRIACSALVVTALVVALAAPASAQPGPSDLVESADTVDLTFTLDSGEWSGGMSLYQNGADVTSQVTITESSEALPGGGSTVTYTVQLAGLPRTDGDILSAAAHVMPDGSELHHTMYVVAHGWPDPAQGHVEPGAAEFSAVLEWRSVQVDPTAVLQVLHNGTDVTHLVSSTQTVGYDEVVDSTVLHRDVQYDIDVSGLTIADGDELEARFDMTATTAGGEMVQYTRGAIVPVYLNEASHVDCVRECLQALVDALEIRNEDGVVSIPDEDSDGDPITIDRIRTEVRAFKDCVSGQDCLNGNRFTDKSITVQGANGEDLDCHVIIGEDGAVQGGPRAGEHVTTGKNDEKGKFIVACGGDGNESGSGGTSRPRGGEGSLVIGMGGRGAVHPDTKRGAQGGAADTHTTGGRGLAFGGDGAPGGTHGDGGRGTVVLKDGETMPASGAASGGDGSDPTDNTKPGGDGGDARVSVDARQKVQAKGGVGGDGEHGTGATAAMDEDKNSSGTNGKSVPNK